MNCCDDQLYSSYDFRIMSKHQCKYVGSQLPLEYGCEDSWGWDIVDKPEAVRIYGSKVAFFHPNYSYGTAGVRGNRALNGGRYYWEVDLGDRVFGTCMAVGIGTKKAKLSSPSFINLIGMDENSWGLNHKGELWYNNECRIWNCNAKKYKPNKIAVYYDGIGGNVTFFRDGHCMGVAFDGLQNVTEDLFPIVCSTAARTTMTLGAMRKEYDSLQERCYDTILKSLSYHSHIHQLQIPRTLKAELCEKYRINFY